MNINNVDLSKMEIINEQEIPVDADPEQIRKDMILASKFFNALAMAKKSKEQLNQQKQQVLNWFAKQEEQIEESENFLRQKIEEALYSAEQAGEKKPKIKTWAGTAFFTSRSKTDWQGLTNKSPEIIEFAKKHGIEVEVIEKTNLTDVKKALLQQPKRELPMKVTRTKTLTIRTED